MIRLVDRVVILVPCYRETYTFSRCFTVTGTSVSVAFSPDVLHDFRIRRDISQGHLLFVIDMHECPY